MTTLELITQEVRKTRFGLWHAYLRFYEATLDKATSAETFDRLIHSSAGLRGILGKDADGNGVGFVHWPTHFATWATINYCYLEDLYVVPDARGQAPKAN